MSHSVDWIALARLLEPVALALVELLRTYLVRAGWVESERLDAYVADDVCAQLQRSVARGTFVDAYGTKFGWDVTLEPKLRAFVRELMEKHQP